jgi:hypothetical protein
MSAQTGSVDPSRPVGSRIATDPAETERRRRFVPVKEIAAALARLPQWEAEPFAAEIAHLDASVDDSDRDPWGDAL